MTEKVKGYFEAKLGSLLPTGELDLFALKDGFMATVFRLILSERMASRLTDEGVADGVLVSSLAAPMDPDLVEYVKKYPKTGEGEPWEVLAARIKAEFKGPRFS